MIYSIKAIPTTYNHVQFRSRLEARWAAFFDLCGWTWDYEPFDLDGWAPDFMLKGKVKALIEVKPINFSGSEEASIRQAKAHAAKAFRTARSVIREAREAQKPFSSYEILVLGNGPFRSDFALGGNWSLGVMALEELTGGDYADLYFGHSQRLDYAARYGNYKYRIGGQGGGDGHLWGIHDSEPEQLWRLAGNAVQWNAKVAA
ncbi:hypothetical protein [Rhizobium rhizogenes]|uniref:hypothetical protein n=1 Tax=Rhizobium rhizogenes TaxID=359 RepID=UPI0004D81F73|nr:hypothetical protein [Rhizobium rhizogenes]KEA07498.1 hypothetical protein CN09_11380 [Rhizobium rhizogenes]NTJ22227.1 hypothetical protein [Rhizobium rhizogenes]QUE80946.1 hypothetical protein EML492_03805 [Rhizobium rhizogenes]TQO80948.1 hypothetical protein FFE80_07600 [Rhizobium rhizogenes]TRB51542.1 hypothetical protein EXN69_26485 [Rhizobium rhizogenes]